MRLLVDMFNMSTVLISCRFRTRAGHSGQRSGSSFCLFRSNKPTFLKDKKIFAWEREREGENNQHLPKSTSCLACFLCHPKKLEALDARCCRSNQNNCDRNDVMSLKVSVQLV